MTDQERHIDPELLDEARYSATLAYMIKHGLPLNREEWIRMNWDGDTPKPWIGRLRGPGPERLAARTMRGLKT